jgi:hypothetical protein
LQTGIADVSSECRWRPTHTGVDSSQDKRGTLERTTAFGRANCDCTVRRYGNDIAQETRTRSSRIAALTCPRVSTIDGMKNLAFAYDPSDLAASEVNG